MDDLTQEQEEHLTGLTTRFATHVTRKYLKGAQEHGGNLWEKDGLLQEAKDEVVDLWVYLDTLEQQLKVNRNLDLE